MKTVLIIDDEILITNALSRMLSNNYRIVALSDPSTGRPDNDCIFFDAQNNYIEMAKNILRSTDIDAVIVDGILGLENGMMLVGQILISQDISKKPVCILLTGDHDMLNFQEQYRRYLPLKNFLSALLLKPFTRTQIVEAIEHPFKPIFLTGAPPADLVKCLQP